MWMAMATVQRATVALATVLVAGAAAGCAAAGNGDNGGPRAAGDVVADAADQVALPVSATYGYLDLTVASFETSDQAPDAVAGAEPATYAAVEVTVGNPVDGAGFTLPPGMFSLVGGGDPVQAVTEDGGKLEVAAGSTTTGTLWFVLPAGATVTDPVLRVNESGFEPLSISLTGVEAAPEQVPVTIEGGYESDCAQVAFGEGIASYNSPVTEDGTHRPGPDVSALGRAPEGSVLVTFDVDATQNCPPGYSQYTLYGGYGLIETMAVGSRTVPRYTDLGLQTQEGTRSGYLAVAVPPDATEPLVLEWREWWTDGNENIVATSRAELDGIGALTSG